MTDLARHLISADATSRYRCSTLLEHGDPHQQEQIHRGSGFLQECLTGHWWCSSCRAQFHLMEWGHAHDFPPLTFTNASGKPATLSKGEYMWLKFCQLAGAKNVEAALEAAKKAQP